VPDSKSAVEEVFHSMTELIFPGAETCGAGALARRL
jgi:hypothetical protein